MAPWALGYTIATLALCWFIYRTFRRDDDGPRPYVAWGCTVIVFASCAFVGLYLLVAAGIGGSAGF